MNALYPVISQVNYPGAGDVDDCAIIATFWAARAAGFAGSLPTVTQFRAAAGVPDRPGPTGLFNRDVWAGVNGTVLGTLQPTLWDGAWSPFFAAVKNGAIASAAVWSGLLPPALRFGFEGAHRVGLVWRDRWYLANPLARDGSAPLPIDESVLLNALLAQGAGKVLAITFPEDTMSVATVTILVKPATPRRFSIAPGVTLLGFKPDVVGHVLRKTFDSASGASFDAVCQIDQSPDATVVPHGGPYLRVIDGMFKGTFVVASYVTADIGPDPAPPPVKRNLVVTVDGEVWKAGSF